MARNRKTVRRGFGYRNCDDFAAYLNHMARQGWHFKEWRAGLVFEKGEPEDAVYAVEVFSKAEETDTRPLPETEEFAEYCEAAGWQFVDAWRKFVVFKRIRPDAVSILTDQERFSAIAKACSHDIWHSFFIALIWCCMKLFEFSFSFSYRIFSPTDLLFATFWTALFLLALLRVIRFLLWKRSCRRRMERGLSLFFGSGGGDRWYDLMYVVFFIVMNIHLFFMGHTYLVMIMLGMVIPLLLMGYILAKLRPDSATNAAIQVIVSMVAIVGVMLLATLMSQTEEWKNRDAAEPPLTYADMDIDLGEPEIRYSKEEESVFGRKQYANLDYGTDYLYYSIYSTEYDWVLDQLWEEETNGRVNEIRDDCTSSWGAVEAFRNNAGHYLVRYEDAVWVISPSLEEPLTSEQIDLIIAALTED